ncbi:MAG: Rpn family recombination-promoting nuclease/putative transposase [Oscillospiraceae bacterium]|nr:Rpn family recombination-promoting nuclease/putative transposase [Oscillospiraceae bacterium]
MNDQNTEANAKRNYKDSVFKKLFGEKEKLSELYNAIAGTDYSPEDIGIITLENVIFAGRENDIAFTAGGRLIVLVEHQSSINPNMPLRFLLYIARQYQMMADNDSMYSSQLMKILPPEFIVVYNGMDEYPEQSDLRLSDAFIEKTDSLDLKATVYNINKGQNPKIMDRSVTLSGYSTFVAMARENLGNGLELSEALKKAVKECIKDNVLREFLERYGSDVVNMLSMEFNLADAQRVWKKDGILEGRKEGIKEGRIEGRIEGEQNKAIKVAENMLKRGMSIEDVANDTELSIEQVEQIAKKIK